VPVPLRPLTLRQFRLVSLRPTAGRSAVGGQQLVVGALPHDPPAVEHDDSVGGGGGQAVRDDDGGAPGGEPVRCGQDHRLGGVGPFAVRIGEGPVGRRVRRAGRKCQLWLAEALDRTYATGCVLASPARAAKDTSQGNRVSGVTRSDIFVVSLPPRRSCDAPVAA